MSKMENSELRRLATTVFLAIVVISSLLIGGFSPHTVVQVGIFIVGLTALTLIILPLMPNLKKLDFKNKNRITGETVFGFDTYQETMVGKVPERLQPKDITIEEKAISNDLKKLLLTGFTPDICQKCLDLLLQNESIVQISWTHTLNKARFLRGVGKTEEATQLLYNVLDKYSYSKEAIGTTYEVFSWFEELEYNEGDKSAQRLAKRLEYVEKGLQFYPQYYQLLINRFEIAYLQQDASKALMCLKKFTKIDKKLAQRYFLDNPLTPEMMTLIPCLEKKITQLIEGETEMSKFELVKIQTLISILVITLGLFASGLFVVSGNQHPQNLLFNEIQNQTNIEKYSIICDGTSVGRFKKGTSVGKLKKTGTSVG